MTKAKLVYMPEKIAELLAKEKNQSKAMVDAYLKSKGLRLVKGEDKLEVVE